MRKSKGKAAMAVAVASKAKAAAWLAEYGVLDGTDGAVADAWSNVKTLQPSSQNANLAEPVFEKKRECNRSKRKAGHLESKAAEPSQEKAGRRKGRRVEPSTIQQQTRTMPNSCRF